MDKWCHTCEVFWLVGCISSPVSTHNSTKINDTMHMKPLIFHLFWEETSVFVNHGKSHNTKFQSYKNTRASYHPSTQLKRAHSHRGTQPLYFVIGDGQCYLASYISHCLTVSAYYLSCQEVVEILRSKTFKQHSVPIALKDMFNWCLQPCKQILSTENICSQNVCVRKTYV